MSMLLRKLLPQKNLWNYATTNSRIALINTRLLNTTDADQPIFDMENPYLKEKQQCLLCKHGVTPDYKNVKLLSQFQSPYTGRIYGRHITGLCEAKQAKLESEIKKAQTSGLMGYYQKEPCFWKDPKLFDPENPIRPHRF